MKQLKHDINKVIITKKVLFVCENNAAIGVMVRNHLDGIGMNFQEHNEHS